MNKNDTIYLRSSKYVGRVIFCLFLYINTYMQNISNLKSDEVGLFELFEKLWKKRRTIFAITCIGIILASIYAFTAKEEWTSEAKIIPPRAVQLGTYLEVQRGFSRYTGGNDVNVGDILNYAHDSLIVMLNAMDNKLTYLKNTDYFQRQTMKKEDEIDKQKLLTEIAEKYLQIREAKNGISKYFDISFTAETAKDANKTLQGYINTTNQLVLDKLFDDLSL